MLKSRISGLAAACIAVVGMIACSTDTQPEGVGVARSAGSIGTAAGFEDDDGNLTVESTFDWNGFKAGTPPVPPLWTGTAPNRQATVDPSAATQGWKFQGIEDAQAVNSDSAFAGGVKQDDNCPPVIGAKAPNKDDLKRIYLASKTGADGHTYLMLAWVRIKQNTTSASAHVGFEFNKNAAPTGACGGNSDGLVNRVAGDMLIVYDFEGGSSVPVLTVRRWVVPTQAIPNPACEVSSDTAPCWAPATNLSTSGFAEAKVNTGPVDDTIGPSGGTESLGTAEFGEAGIDLTAAGIFTAGTCDTFGTAFGVSRSSGSSATAQMKDLVGPAPFMLTNCGTVKIIKHTDPRGINQSFGFTSTVGGTSANGTVNNTPFSLNDNGNTTGDSTGNTRLMTNVPPGSYTVTENDPSSSGFALESLTCTTGGSQDSTNALQANITIAAGDTVTCTYTNERQLGAIKITKTNSKDNSNLAGAVFTITRPNGSTFDTPATGSDGTVCVDGLAFGNGYKVKEKSAPPHFAIDDTSEHTFNVTQSSTCGDGHEVTDSFADSPLTDIVCTATSQVAAPHNAASKITCKDADGNVIATSGTLFTNPASASANGLKPGTYTCTVEIDP